MQLTIQILAKNNAEALKKTIQSVQPLNPKIVIVDLGSTDKTLEMALSMGAIIQRYPVLEHDHSEARNRSLKNLENGWMLWLQPGEIIAQGHDQLKNVPFGLYNLKIFQEKTIMSDVRLWYHEHNLWFVNPVYEYLECKSDMFANAYLYSEFAGPQQVEEKLTLWKEKQPTSPKPYYYEASYLLSQKKYDDFLRVSEHYMFLSNNFLTISTTMNRYYYALVMMHHKHRVRETLQNINLCLTANPLMAEFWCLIGDVYYLLLKKFEMAKEFYELALHVGGFRKNNDLWPMDISKYQDYPEQMIESCNKLIAKKSAFELINHNYQ